MIEAHVPGQAGLSMRMQAFSGSLDAGERDCLKFRLSLASAARLDGHFEISADPVRRRQFFDLLRLTLATQPFHRRVPRHGIAYLARPAFMTDALLAGLRDEATAMRPSARANHEQFIVTVDTPREDTLCERLASSRLLLELVTRHAGPCEASHISSYIYYDQAGQCSKPHVDNAFTALTAMIGLRHDHDRPLASASASIAYWPDCAPLAYRLAPGEIAVFFGSGVLHGRTPVAENETVHSLLLSFRPRPDDQGSPHDDIPR